MKRPIKRNKNFFYYFFTILYYLSPRSGRFRVRELPYPYKLRSVAKKAENEKCTGIFYFQLFIVFGKIQKEVRTLPLFETKQETKPEAQKLAPPRHIAIIMDGNGRWAKKRGLPRTAGHAQGARVVEQILEDADHMGIRYLTV